MMDPAYEPPADTIPLDMAAAAPRQPFERIRARTVVWWVAAWFVVLVVCAALGAPIELLVYTVYPVLLAWVVYETRHHGLHIQDFIRRPTMDAVRRLWLVVPSLCVSLAVVVLAVTLLHLSPDSLHDRSTELTLRHGTSSPDAAITIAGMVIVAPFTEELVFRGIILHRWTQKWGFVRAVLASSAAFGLLHPDPLGAFLFAIIMVHLYTWSGTLVVPMAAHALNNAVVVAAMLGGTRSPDAATGASEATEVAKAVPGAILLGALGLLALLFYFRGIPPMSEWRLPRITARDFRDDVTPAR